MSDLKPIGLCNHLIKMICILPISMKFYPYIAYTCNRNLVTFLYKKHTVITLYRLLRDASNFVNYFTIHDPGHLYRL